MSSEGNLDWKVARHCDGGACVGVARRGDAVLIGNTNDPAGPVSVFTIGEWHEFLAGAKLGDFDDLS
jgi:hypothetical protein